MSYRLLRLTLIREKREQNRVGEALRRSQNQNTVPLRWPLADRLDERLGAGLH